MFNFINGFEFIFTVRLLSYPPQPVFPNIIFDKNIFVFALSFSGLVKIIKILVVFIAVAVLGNELTIK